MGGLSMNPDNPGLESGPKLAHQIAVDEEWGGVPGDHPEKEEIPQKAVEEKPAKKMKLGSFEIDTTYPRTLLGIMRILQVLLLIVSFVCLVITPTWPDEGTYTFFCIFLVFGALISGYLLFTVIAGIRNETICGLSWIIVELVYFGLYGFLIFLGSCLAANKSGGDPALTAAAVFGFGAVITFVYYFWITWKLRKAHLKDLEEEKKENDEEEGENDAESKHSLPPGFQDQNEFMIEKEDLSVHNSRRPSLNFGRQNNSLPINFQDQAYKNQKRYKGKNHRRRHSASDKDSAYSEGTITPTKGKTLPPKMRRTASARFDEEYDHVLQKQPLAHLSHRPYGGPPDHGRRRTSGLNAQGRIGYGYPGELATTSFSNAGYDHGGERIVSDDLHESMRRRKSMPGWLRAALGNDVEGEDTVMDDDQSEGGLLAIKRTSTLPGNFQREFPLLDTWDDESINYPSISQNGPGRQFHTLSPQDANYRVGGGRGSKRHYRHNGHHHGRRRRGQHHQHGRKPNHIHRHHHRHHGRHHRSGGGGMRRPVNEAHDDYLRHMMENDELMAKDEVAGKELGGFEPHHGKPIQNGKRRVIPEQPFTIQFPEHSRWDDEAGHIGNPVMEKYFAES